MTLFVSPKCHEPLSLCQFWYTLNISKWFFWFFSNFFFLSFEIRHSDIRIDLPHYVHTTHAFAMYHFDTIRLWLNIAQLKINSLSTFPIDQRNWANWWIRYGIHFEGWIFGFHSFYTRRRLLRLTYTPFKVVCLDMIVWAEALNAKIWWQLIILNSDLESRQA